MQVFHAFYENQLMLMNLHYRASWKTPNETFAFVDYYNSLKRIRVILIHISVESVHVFVEMSVNFSVYISGSETEKIGK